MMTAINCDKSIGGWHSAAVGAGVLTENMDKVFAKKSGDEMPAGDLYGIRNKLIHTVGPIGQVSWVSNGNHNYTGLFQGANKCFARMSQAKEPDSKKKFLTPGMGLKCLRDGVDSGNLVAMFSVDGQESWNFFQNDFVTHIPESSVALNLTFGKSFARATKFIQQVGLSDMAKYGQNGQAIADSNLNFPYSLRFEPSGEVSFPEDFQGIDVNQMLESVTAGSNLYNIFAMSAPKDQGGVESNIGKLVLDQKMTVSKWGDKGFFVRHQNYVDDLTLRPAWTASTPRFGLTGKNADNTCPISKAKLTSKCPFF